MVICYSRPDLTKIASSTRYHEIECVLCALTVGEEQPGAKSSRDRMGQVMVFVTTASRKGGSYGS